MTAWRYIADFAIPPALLLTLLLILPLPMVLRKGLLIFARKVLFFNVLGGINLLYLMQFVTMCSLTATSLHTYQRGRNVVDDSLTPNAKMGILARKWREERNFWICVVAFLSWVFVGRGYALLVELVGAKDELQAQKLHHHHQQQLVLQLREQLNAALALEGQGSGGVPASDEGGRAPSAPPPPRQLKSIDSMAKKGL